MTASLRGRARAVSALDSYWAVVRRSRSWDRRREGADAPELDLGQLLAVGAARAHVEPEQVLLVVGVLVVAIVRAELGEANVDDGVGKVVDDAHARTHLGRRASQVLGDEPERAARVSSEDRRGDVDEGGAKRETKRGAKGDDKSQFEKVRRGDDEEREGTHFWKRFCVSTWT